MKKRYFAAVALVAAAAVALAGCASGTQAGGSGDTKTLTLAQAQKATSADDFGGFDGLVAAAKKEGHLNVITLPPSWANYGKIIQGFQKKYPEIKINSENPDGSSADEIAAVKSQKGQSTAPDVLDLGTAVMLQNLDLYAPYKVQSWGDIPDSMKDADGKWFNDYTGIMSVGYDTKKFPGGVTSLDDLLKPEFKNAVAIKGDPTQANEAQLAVAMATVQSNGTLDDIQPGIDFFQKLKQAGNYVSTLPTQATVASGETPVVIQWNYNNTAWGPDAGSAGNPNWKTIILPGTGVTSYYNQAINADAPNPAAARLWEEYLYTPEVQNLFLQAGASPAQLAAMVKAKTVDQRALDKLGAPKDLVQFTPDQATKAATLLSSKWAAAIG
jgi:putative spermidine/putrescine transport system substrate-binding protein